MVYVPHTPVKAEKLALTAIGMLEQELLIPSLFTKIGLDAYKGAKDDTLSVTVEGVLPYRDYGWRNDRSSGIVFDEYAERKVSVTFGGNTYNAVQLTDEQNDMDFDGWSRLLRPQSKAVARGLGRKAVAYLVNAPYNVVIGDCELNIRGAMIEARRVLNAFHVPDGNRYMVVGTDWESLILADEKIVLAQNSSEATAESALREASIGRLFGFNIIVDQTIGSSDAYAFATSAFVLLTAAPSVPSSVAFGATTSFEGLALRWVRDYDPTHMVDRSVVNCYNGFQTVKDVLVGWDANTNSEVVSEAEYFVRGVKLTLGGASDYPTYGEELAVLTGISSNKVFAHGGKTVEAPTSVTVTPASVTIAAAGTQQMVATANYPSGHTADVTALCTWSSATPAKATISAGGLVTGVASGTSVMSALYGGVTGTKLVTVS